MIKIVLHQLGSLLRKLPNGEVTEAIGGCERSEKGGKTTNDIVATAHTRANLRAISQLIDFGKVSADEISSIEEIKPKRQINLNLNLNLKKS